MQTVSPGRIVLYCFRDRQTKMLTERPAIVTSVADPHVNLTVFFERNDEDECMRGVSGDPDFDSRYEDVPENREDPSNALPRQNTWRWPPRV